MNLTLFNSLLIKNPDVSDNSINSIGELIEVYELKKNDKPLFGCKVKYMTYSQNYVLDFLIKEKLVTLKDLAYSRNPTEAEIKFGHGATHYKDFDSSTYLTKDLSIKKRIKCPIDGLIYTRY